VTRTSREKMRVKALKIIGKKVKKKKWFEEEKKSLIF
jgi:hypothetical protein